MNEIKVCVIQNPIFSFYLIFELLALVKKMTQIKIFCLILVCLVIQSECSDIFDLPPLAAFDGIITPGASSRQVPREIIIVRIYKPRTRYTKTPTRPLWKRFKRNYGLDFLSLPSRFPHLPPIPDIRYKFKS